MDQNNAVYLMLAVLLVLLLMLGVVIYLLLQSGKAKNRAEEKYYLLEMKVNDLQLETLESKLNPHLFKNILNSVQSHAYQTYMSLDKLANVLDYILYESNNKFVSPKEELSFAISLIEINKIKVNPLFDFRIKSKIDKSDSLFE